MPTISIISLCVLSLKTPKIALWQVTMNLLHIVLAFRSAHLKRKEKSESFTQWDINSSTSYSTYSNVRLASKDAKDE